LEINQKINKLWLDHKQLKNSNNDFKLNNLVNFQSILKDNQEMLARVIRTEMGKTLDEAKGEINRCVLHCQYYLDDPSRINLLQHTHFSKNDFVHSIDPKGVMFKIVPFNFPLWLGLKFAIPSIVLGNSVLIRPPETCPGSAQIIQDEITTRNIIGLDYIFSDVTQTESIIQNPFIKGIF
jgi:acyl-CoA reductase-like NAD-dependent aldehyde dehydrogenase